jgi:hypothetical protein
VVREHLETFLARRAEEGEPMPSFVVDELRDYLRCGVLARGAVRFLCEHCGRDRLVALSCKGRGFCPRCMGRRMTEMARHWVSAVLPRVRIRQWVLSLPFELRVPLAYHHDLTLAVHGVAARVIEGWYRDKGRELGIIEPRTGNITAVQRFGSDLARERDARAPLADARSITCTLESATITVMRGLDHEEVSAVVGTRDGLAVIAPFLDALVSGS